MHKAFSQKRFPKNFPQKLLTNNFTFSKELISKTLLFPAFQSVCGRVICFCILNLYVWYAFCKGVVYRYVSYFLQLAYSNMYFCFSIIFVRVLRFSVGPLGGSLVISVMGVTCGGAVGLFYLFSYIFYFEHLVFF